MPVVLSRLSILINYIVLELDKAKILLYKLSARYLLVVKPARANAA